MSIPTLRSEYILPFNHFPQYLRSMNLLNGNREDVPIQYDEVSPFSYLKRTTIPISKALVRAGDGISGDHADEINTLLGNPGGVVRSINRLSSHSYPYSF